MQSDTRQIGRTSRKASTGHSYAIVKLVKKTRVGSRLRRVYGPAVTPFDRVRVCPDADATR